MNIETCRKKALERRTFCTLLVLIACSAMGCKHRREQPVIESPEFYFSNLRNQDFVWRGSTSREDRIPKLHAARALAYIGDPAVPCLFRAITDESIEIVSIYDALSEIGLPVELYQTQIIENRSSSDIVNWWKLHGTETRHQRELYRKEIGIID
jgi:hypothetical protein